MNNPEKRTSVLKCLQENELWDSNGNFFDINFTRDIIYIKSST